MTQWSKELLFYRLERAQEALEDARILANSERWNACVNRLYYACFYAVLALLQKKKLTAHKHSSVRTLFNIEFVKTGVIDVRYAKFYAELFENRQESDYAEFVEFKSDDVAIMLKRSVEFIEMIEGKLTHNG